MINQRRCQLVGWLWEESGHASLEIKYSSRLIKMCPWVSTMLHYGMLSIHEKCMFWDGDRRPSQPSDAACTCCESLVSNRATKGYLNSMFSQIFCCLISSKDLLTEESCSYEVSSLQNDHLARTEIHCVCCYISCSRWCLRRFRASQLINCATYEWPGGCDLSGGFIKGVTTCAGQYFQLARYRCYMLYVIWYLRSLVFSVTLVLRCTVILFKDCPCFEIANLMFEALRLQAMDKHPDHRRDVWTIKACR